MATYHGFELVGHVPAAPTEAKEAWVVFLTSLKWERPIIDALLRWMGDYGWDTFDDLRTGIDPKEPHARIDQIVEQLKLDDGSEIPKKGR